MDQDLYDHLSAALPSEVDGSRRTVISESMGVITAIYNGWSADAKDLLANVPFPGGYMKLSMLLMDEGEIVRRYTIKIDGMPDVWK